MTLSSRKSGFGAFVALALLLWTPNETVQAQPADWYDDFHHAMAVAKREGKPIIAEVGSDECPACRNLERTTLRDPQIQARLNGFVKVHINGNEQPGLRQQLGVNAYPTMLAMDSNGRVVGTTVGSVPPRELAPALDKALATAARQRPHQEQIVQARKTPAADAQQREGTAGRASKAGSVLATSLTGNMETGARGRTVAATAAGLTTRGAQPTLSRSVNYENESNPVLAAARERAARTEHDNAAESEYGSVPPVTLPSNAKAAPKQVTDSRSAGFEKNPGVVSPRAATAPTAIARPRTAPTAELNFYTMGAGTSAAAPTKLSVETLDKPEPRLIAAAAPDKKVSPSEKSVLGGADDAEAAPAPSAPAPAPAGASEDEAIKPLLKLGAARETQGSAARVAAPIEATTAKKAAETTTEKRDALSTIRRMQGIKPGAAAKPAAETETATAPPATKPAAAVASAPAPAAPAPVAAETEEPAEPLPSTRAATSVSKEDITRWMKQADDHLQDNQKREAHAMYKKVFEQDQENKFGQSDRAFIQMVALSVDTDDDALRRRAYSQIKEFTTRFPTSKRTDNYRVIRAILAADLGETDQAHRLLDNFEKEFPTSRYKKLAHETWQKLPPVKNGASAAAAISARPDPEAATN